MCITRAWGSCGLHSLCGWPGVAAVLLGHTLPFSEIRLLFPLVKPFPPRKAPSPAFRLLSHVATGRAASRRQVPRPRTAASGRAGSSHRHLPTRHGRRAGGAAAANARGAAVGGGRRRRRRPGGGRRRAAASAAAEHARARGVLGGGGSAATLRACGCDCGRPRVCVTADERHTLLSARPPATPGPGTAAAAAAPSGAAGCDSQGRRRCALSSRRTQLSLRERPRGGCGTVVYGRRGAVAAAGGAAARAAAAAGAGGGGAASPLRLRGLRRPGGRHRGAGGSGAQGLRALRGCGVLLEGVPGAV